MRYFSMFSGGGGFENGIEKAYDHQSKDEGIRGEGYSTINNIEPSQGASCVGYSEIDKWATSVYRAQYPSHKAYGDATRIVWGDVPDFDILVGGFPCQSFSIAGQRGGFEDRRGTLFFEIARGLRNKRPRAGVFENVEGLLSAPNLIGTGFYECTQGGGKGTITSDLRRVKDEPERVWKEIAIPLHRGHCFLTILCELDELGYDAQWELLNSQNFGVPQNRSRVFIVASARDKPRLQIFPLGQGSSGNHQGHGEGQSSDIAPTIDRRVGDSTHRSPYIVSRNPRKGDPGKGGTGVLMSDEHCFTVDHDPHYVMGTLRTHKDGEGFREIIGDVSPAIPARAREDGSGQPIVMALDLYNKKAHADRTPTLTEPHHNSLRMQIGNQMRRLTPVECERLQGYPDNWTANGVDEDGKIINISDSQRYKILGNAVTTNVIESIFEKVRKCL
jgi:DNA (cytosine-5)-methyltransferase 1